MIVLTCSGTGGHVYPAIAVASYLGEQGVMFVVDKGRVAERIVRDNGFLYRGLEGVGAGLWGMLRAFWRMLLFFRSEQVEKVLSFGGFATVPVVLAAWVCRVPVTLFEQNAIPGRANRGLAFFSQRVCLALRGSESYFNGKAVLVGNPVRSSYERDDVLEEVLGVRWKLGRRCLVFGGSQGAEALNMFIASEYGFFSRQSIQVIHVVGEAYYQAHFLDAPYYVGEAEDGIEYVVLPYIKNMKRAYAWADYVISRAGATTVAELQYFKKQALLVPYPYAKDNHQVANAQVLCDDDSAICVDQEALSEAVLEGFFDRPIVAGATRVHQAVLDQKWQAVL